jgi:hypothetical protein
MGQTSTPRRITIVSRDQLEARLAGEQAQIARRLEESLKLQRATRGDVHGLGIQLRDARQLAAGDRDTLLAAELNQRRVGRSLVASADGIVAQAETLIAELQINGITDGDLSRQMDDLKQALGLLAAGPLPTAERELSSARKTAESTRENAATKHLADSLATAIANQDQTIASVERLLSELSGAADYGQLVRDLTQLREDQLAHQTISREAVSLETLPLELRELSRQQRATLNKAADGEDALARRYERIEQGIERLAKEVSERDAAAAERLVDATELAKLLGIGSLMQQAGRDWSGNRVGQALEGEARVADALQELIDNLRERSRLRPEELVSKLRAAEQELASQRAELARLREQLAQAEQNSGRRPPESASEEQKQLQEKIAQLARQLRRLQAAEAGKSAGQAAQKLGQGGEQSASAGTAQQAEQDLASAARQLAARRAQAEEDLARAILQRFQGELQTMIADQKDVLRVTTELATRLGGRLNDAAASKADQEIVAGFAGKERELAVTAHDNSELLAGLHVIGLALGDAAQQLKTAASQLDQHQLGTAAQQSEQRALDRLEQIAAALEQAKQAAGNQMAGSPPGNSGGSGKQPKRPMIELFEAKLLRSLQADLQERTDALQQRIAANPPGAAESRAANDREAEDLAAEQGHLAELVGELRTRDNGSDDQAQ